VSERWPHGFHCLGLFLSTALATWIRPWDLLWVGTTGICALQDVSSTYRYAKPRRYQYSITLCAEISAAALLINFWDQEEKYNPAIWISLIIVLILCLNIFAVGIYGEAEFIFASIKIITMCGLLLLGLIIMLGGAPDHDRRGFRYVVCRHRMYLKLMLSLGTGKRAR
jgi:membrane protein YdbS with pleckstrin-like domain